MFEDSTELTISTIRKIRSLMEFLKAIEVKDSVIFYLVSQVIDLITADPFLSNGFIEDKYNNGDWKILWKGLLDRVGLTNSALVNGEF